MKTGREFNSLAVNLHTAKKIKDKIAFWNECTELDLKVPKYKIMPIDVATEIRNLKFQGFFGQRRRYVLKTLNTSQNEDDINVGNDFEQKPIPIEDSEFENYLRDLKDFESRGSTLQFQTSNLPRILFFRHPQSFLSI